MNEEQGKGTCCRIYLFSYFAGRTDQLLIT